MLTIQEARTRVATGAAHLDVVRPGWHDQIDVGTLTLHDPCGCIVGQLCPTVDADFLELASWLFPKSNDYSPWGVDIAMSDPYTNGALVDHSGEMSFAILQNAWIEAIADRRLQAGAVDVPQDVEVPA